MKTLADFKRAMQVGTKWEGYNHFYQGSFGVRECIKRQTERFAFRSPTGEPSWCDFPKADDIEFGEDGTVKIYSHWHGNERYHLLSYKQVV